MSIGLENFQPQIEPVTGDYPFGDIKDNTGPGDGTNVDRFNHADYHQTWRRLLYLASINPNGTPDNVSNGFQYIDALDKLFKNYRGIFGVGGSTALTEDQINKVIMTGGGAACIHTLPDSSTLRDGDKINFINVGSGTVDVTEFLGDVILNNPGQLQTGDFMELVLSKGLGAWACTNHKVTVAPAAPVFVFNTISIALSSATSDILKFQTHQYGDASLYDITTGRFKPTIAGVYELTWSVIYNTNGTPSQFYAGTNARKNGVQIGFITDRQDVYTTSDWLTLSGSVIVEANGTTDYFDIQVYSSVAVAKTIYGNFHAKRIVS